MFTEIKQKWNGLTTNTKGYITLATLTLWISIMVGILGTWFASAIVLTVIVSITLIVVMCNFFDGSDW